MSQATRPPVSQSIVERTRRAIDTHGLKPVALAAGVSTATITRAAAGMGLQPASLKALVGGLDELERGPAAVTA